ncbi:hypothetical protein [Mycobacteroides abscessus]|uniref:hypothetical protein n=1 Tax=Mycobacteroides abscessus TaxID=36809 RepID=UPI0018969DB0|nr:hypothetical protein [Mycobacteroides abscessus]
MVIVVEPVNVLAEHLPRRRRELTKRVITLVIADPVIAHAMDQIWDIRMGNKEPPPRGRIVTTLRDDSRELLDHRLDTVFMKFKVVRQFGVKFLELPRILISVGDCRFR